MPGAGSPALDLSTLLQYACTLLAFFAAALFLIKKAASIYFVVGDGFEGNEEFKARQHMSNEGVGGDTGAVCAALSECAVCTRSATKKCSRCKSVWYCSQVCQSIHWRAGHRSKCRQVESTGKFDTRGAGPRRKFSAISLVPDHGTRKVLKEPKKILFPYDEFVKLFDWDKAGFVPCGLLNCGNSCFANVVLQCLACTRPLFAYLLEEDHNRGCLRKREDWCFLCELQAHIKRASESSQPFSPINILSRLPNIGGNLGYGRQEDAHEFMRFAIDTMQSICLDEYGGEKAVEPSTQETTIVQYIFGGHLQSQVICTNCNAVSNRYENMLDLTVEIHGDSGSLEECLDQFTVKEWLDGENMYKCDGCDSYVKAWKRLTVHRAPNVLTIALKRFQSGRFGKLNKRVTFPENLDLTPYMSASGDGTDQYTLYGVIVHLDMLNASFFGHYICYIKDYGGQWYKIDDCKVMKVEVEEVLAQGAYMLLYHRRNPRRDPFVKPAEPTPTPHLAESNLETLKTQNTINSSSNVASSVPIDAEPLMITKPQPIILCLESSSDESRETEHEERNGNYSEDMNLDLPGIDKSSSTSIVNDIKLEDSNLSENITSLIESMPSNPSNPADFSPSEVEAIECEQPHSHFDANLSTKEGEYSINLKESSEQFLTDKDIIVAASSVENGCIIPQPVPGIHICQNSSLECNGSKKVLKDNLKAREKQTIFPRGFLNKPVCKKPAGHEKTVLIETNGASLQPKINGYSNGHGHVDIHLDANIANDNGLNLRVSGNGNSTPDSPSFSNGLLPRTSNNGKVECNGALSSSENAIQDIGLELACSGSETIAEMDVFSCNGVGAESKSLNSSVFMFNQGENQVLKQLNGSL